MPYQTVCTLDTGIFVTDLIGIVYKNSDIIQICKQFGIQLEQLCCECSVLENICQDISLFLCYLYNTIIKTVTIGCVTVVRNDVLCTSILVLWISSLHQNQSNHGCTCCYKLFQRFLFLQFFTTKVNLQTLDSFVP